MDSPLPVAQLAPLVLLIASLALMVIALAHLVMVAGLSFMLIILH
jgi:hypothetical protein